MGALVGILVSAAGSMAGGLAEGAIMGNGKGGTGPEIPKVDPSGAVAFYNQAGQAVESNYLQGLDFYKAAITKAQTQVNQGYDNAKITLAPMDYTGKTSFNELGKFFNLNPYTPADTAASQIGAIDNDGRYLSLATQLQSANNETDPAKRAQLKSQLTDEYNTLQQNPYTSKIAALGDKNPVLFATGFNTVADALNSDPADKTSRENVYREDTYLKMINDTPGMYHFSGNIEDGQQNYDEAHKVMSDEALAQKTKEVQSSAAYNDYITNYDSKKNDLESQMAAWQLDSSALTNDFSNWKSNYTDTKDVPYTGQEKTDRIRETPGYLAQLSEGTRVTNTTQAKNDVMSDQNLVDAVRARGVSTADNYYGNYINTLSQSAAANLPGSFQLAANEMSRAQNLAGLDVSEGQAAQNTYQGIGDSWYKSYTKQGDVTWDAEKTNTQMKYDIYKQSQQNKADLTKTGIDSAAGLGMLDVQNQKFEAKQASDLNTGAGFLMNQQQQNNSGQYYQSGGMMFRDWGML